MITRWKELRTQYWNNRPARERRIIAIAGMVLLPIVYYYLLWQPAHIAAAKLHNNLPALQAQATKLQDQATEIEMLRHRPVIVALDAVALKSSIAESATRHQMSTYINGNEVQEPNAVRITCDAIPFAMWIKWLRELEQEQHIRAEAISISALPQTGMVKISASLSNGIIQ
jgi:type II secretory pathway component PulM